MKHLASILLALILVACGGGGENVTGDSIPVKKVLAASPGANFTGNGWYWDSTAGGTGMAFEAQGSTGFAGLFMYDASGKPIWYVSFGTFSASQTGYQFTGDLRRYSGGQSLGSAWKSPTSVSVGTLNIGFTGSGKSTNALVSLPGGRLWNTVRFNFNGIDTGNTSTQPESAWYWNAAEGGRGYAIEVQNGQMFMAMFHYAADGSPTWQVVQNNIDSSGKIASAIFQKYANGQTLTSGWVAPQGPAIDGFISANFGSSCAGSITIQGYSTVFLQKFSIGGLASGAECRSGGAVTQGDPLLVYQWHIQNSGTPSFASVPPVAGNDLNIVPVWQSGITGRGIKVAIVDSGLEAAHEDLVANVDLSNSYNFLTGTNNPTRFVGDPGSDHGTQVAGIVAATAFNGIGGRGVAYNARLRGYNLLAPGAYTISNFAFAMGGSALSADNDLFNASFARIPQAALSSFSGTFNAINQNFSTLRGGKGAPLVNAAGNSFESINGYPDVCVLANYFGVSCHDPATDERMGGTTPIIVGAFNAEGKRSSYSSTGSSLWVVAPGGEYGKNSNYVPGTGAEFNPAIVTTARPGCSNATNHVAVNALDSLGLSPFAPNCQYTALMNGTSSAAPNTSAVIALMLEANPTLTVRDIKGILAKTAKRIDMGFAGVSSTQIIPGNTVTLESGWIQNAAGYWFSNWYGFGAVDAVAAVNAAKALVNHLPIDKSYTATTSVTGAIIPALNPNGYSFIGNISPGFQTVEQVVLFINIAQTPTNLVSINGKSVSLGLQCVQIEMTSPSGTKSIVLHAATGLSNSSVNNARILTNAFYGEPANGNWRLKFLNYCDGNAGQAVLSAVNPQSFIIVGH